MNTYEIKASSIPFKGYYASHVLTEGHVPGTLSGAELAGKAKKYGGWYSRMRTRVKAWVERNHGIISRVALVNSRWCLVWVKEGQRIEISLVQ